MSSWESTLRLGTFSASQYPCLSIVETVSGCSLCIVRQAWFMAQKDWKDDKSRSEGIMEDSENGSFHGARRMSCCAA